MTNGLVLHRTVEESTSIQWVKYYMSSTIITVFRAIVSMQYYGLSLNVGNLSGSLYLNYFLTALTEVCAYTLCIPGLYCTGRKKFHCACMIVGGVALLTVVFPTIWKGPGTFTLFCYDIFPFNKFESPILQP